LCLYASNHFLAFFVQTLMSLGGAENARLENAGLELSAPNCRGGKCRTGIFGTVLRGTRCEEYRETNSMQQLFARFPNAILPNSANTSNCAAIPTKMFSSFCAYMHQTIFWLTTFSDPDVSFSAYSLATAHVWPVIFSDYATVHCTDFDVISCYYWFCPAAIIHVTSAESMAQTLAPDWKYDSRIMCLLQLQKAQW